MAKPWVRLYRDAITKPKVGRLSLECLGFWSACLMLSDDEGRLPDAADIMWTLRLQEGDVDRLMSALERHGLVTRDVTETVTGQSRFRLHDWDVHQRKSDHDESGTDRKRRQREREKEAKKNKDLPQVTDMSRVTSRTGHGIVPLPDTDTDTDTDKKERVETREQVRDAQEPQPRKSKPVSSKAGSTTPKGSRWPADAIVPDDWLEAGHDARAGSGMAAIDLRAEALKFANYWAAKSGGGATKVDWKRTWINWCLTARGNQQNGAGIGRKSQLEQLQEIIAGERTGDVLDG